MVVLNVHNPNTENIVDFGYRELEEASKLFKLVYMIPEETIEGELKLFFNKDSGLVGVMDEGFNVWALNGDKIERFYSCFGCSEEGFKDDILEYHTNETTQECKEFLKYLKLEVKPDDAWYGKGSL